MPVDTTELQRLQRELEAAARNAPQEFKRVLVSGTRAAKTEFKRAAGVRYNAKAGRIAEGITVSAPDLTRLEFEVVASNRPLSGISYGAKQTRQGLRLSVIRGTVSIIRAGFIPKSGARSGLPFRREGPARHPIKFVYGPSVADMVLHPTVGEAATGVVVGRMQADMQRRVTRLLGAGGGAGGGSP